MTKHRLEAFTDGVIAIIITIMVLELKVPHGADFATLAPLAPVFLSYALSFIYVAIYWNNHHHLFQLVKNVDGPTMWANMHLLFWLSLIPFVTGWSGENHFEPAPVALYGLVLIMSSMAFYVLTRVLIRNHGENSDLQRALGSELKEKLSTLAYGVGIAVSFWSASLALGIYVGVALTWLLPDRRVERQLKKS